MEVVHQVTKNNTDRSQFILGYNCLIPIENFKWYNIEDFFDEIYCYPDEFQEYHFWHKEWFFREFTADLVLFHFPGNGDRKIAPPLRFEMSVLGWTPGSEPDADQAEQMDRIRFSIEPPSEYFDIENGEMVHAMLTVFEIFSRTFRSMNDRRFVCRYDRYRWDSIRNEEDIRVLSSDLGDTQRLLDIVDAAKRNLMNSIDNPKT